MEKIRALSAGAPPHKEIPQQKKVLGSVDLKEVVKQASALIGEEMEGYGGGHRVRGKAKKDRDILIYALWEMGLFRNEEIGQVFGVSYSAVSHIAGDVRETMKKDPRIEGKVKRINSQFKM